jgi:hypothetical protein
MSKMDLLMSVLIFNWNKNARKNRFLKEDIMHLTRFRFLTVLILVLLFISCIDREHSNPLDPEYKSEQMKTLARTGTLQPVQGATLGPLSLKIITLAGSAMLDAQGNFSVSANEAVKYQLLPVVSTATGNVVYIGLYDPATKKTALNDTSTVLSLLLHNPHLLYSTQSHRRQYVDAAKVNSRFSQLIAAFRQGMLTNAEKVFDFEFNPSLYQTAALVMKETIEYFQSGGLKKAGAAAAVEEPTVEDASGADVVFVNPRHVFYGAGIYPNDATLRETVTVRRQEGIVGFKWAWPPLVLNEPARTVFALGNGYFRVYLTKRMDFSKFAQWDDPVGRSTVCNMAQAVTGTFDLLIGTLPNPSAAKLPQYFTIGPARLAGFEESIRTKNALGFISAFAGSVGDNKTGLAQWLWQDAADNARKEAAGLLAEKCSGIFSSAALAFKLLSYPSGAGPLFYDMMYAPDEINYSMTQANGVLTINTQNLPPVAKFTFNPAAGVIGTVFGFNASASTDDHDALAQLQFRWDWESDGTWDTGWSPNPGQTHYYTKLGAFTVTLQVMDAGGLTGTATHALNVGGGAGTATHVKVFRDVLPWKSSALDNVLAGLGFTLGTGKNTYEVLPSSQMAAASLVPGVDLVIISNDQNQDFYNRYAQSQVRFTGFVNSGGSLFWEACDNGWAKGSMATAGIVLPGNLVTTYNLDSLNTVYDLNLPLVSGLPKTMDHNYASHESFSNLPDGTIVYCVNQKNEPTLIEFNLGAGWIIVTGQPLEHQYDQVYKAPDMEKLLPRIVAYFTGKPLAKALGKPVMEKSTVPSHFSKQ